MFKKSRPPYWVLLIVTLFAMTLLRGLVGDPTFPLKGQMQRKGSHPQAIGFPFHFSHQPVESSYQLRGRIQFGKKTDPVVRVFPDDCVSEIKINGRAVDLTRFSAKELCDGQNGFELDLSSYLHPGSNESTWTIKNLRDAFGLSFKPSVHASFTKSLLTIIDATIERLDDPWRQISAPIQSSYREKIPSRVLIEGTVKRSFLSPSFIQFRADDCLTHFEINGHALPEELLTADGHCVARTSIFINVGPYLHSGENQVKLELKNLGGPYSLIFLPVYSDPMTAAYFLIQLAFLFLIWSFALHGSLHRFEFRSRMERWAPPAILACGTLLRMIYVFYLHPAENHVFSDAANYITAGRQIAAGIYLLRQVFQSVTFPAIVGFLFENAQGSYILIYWMQFLLGVFSMLLAWRGSTRLVGERGAVWVLLLFAFQFQVISLTGFVLTENLFGFLITLLYFLLVKYRYPWRCFPAFLIGAVTAAGMTVKGNNAFFVPIFFSWVIIRKWNELSGVANRAQKVLLDSARPLFSFFLGMALIFLLIGMYSQAKYGKFNFSSASGGLNFVEGKCPDKINVDSEGRHWQSPLFAQLGESGTKVWPRPFSDQSFFFKAGLDCIAENPSVLLTSFRYVYFLIFDNVLWPANTTQYAPLNRDYSKFYGTFLFPGIVIGLGLLVRRRWALNRLPYLLVLSVMACVWMFKGEIRFRIPFECVFLPLAVLGWMKLIGTFPHAVKRVLQSDIVFCLCFASFLIWMGGTLLFE